jgi:endonuclease G
METPCEQWDLRTTLQAKEVRVDTRQLFSDRKLRQEFLDRFPELVAARSNTGSLEGLDCMPRPVTDDALRAVDRMAEGTWTSDAGGLEAIILRFTRPVHLVQQDTFATPPDDFPNSHEIAAKLEHGRKAFEAAIPSTGRIEVTNHRLGWIGTGWLVAEARGRNLLITNRHVAIEFAREDKGFPFRINALKRQLSARVDWYREHERPEVSSFRITKVLHIEPEPSFDVAVLEVLPVGEDANAQPTQLPKPLTLATADDYNAIGVGTWVGVIGYPAHDSRNNDADQQRIFDGIYNVKRLAPGQVRAIRPDGLITHDATTLGGNSGSAIVDLASGKAIALHFGGVEGENNFAVQAPTIQLIIDNLQ